MNTAKIIDYNLYHIKGGKKSAQLRKDGKRKRTTSNKPDGVSSEVYAFRNADEIKRIIEVLNYKIENSYGKQEKQIARRNKLLFILGMNLGIRASDIRELRWEFFFDDDGEFRRFYSIKPTKTKKTGKYVKLFFNNAVKIAIKEYINNYPVNNMEDHIFVSREGKPITVQTMWNVIKGTAKEAGIKQNVGSHSLRKTWGYWVWHEAEDKNRMLVLLQQCFGHSSTVVTMKYIGISDNDIEDVYMSINLGCG